MPCPAPKVGGALYASQGTKLFEAYECRGTMFNEATNLSPVTKLAAGNGAVSPIGY